jgi:hypothetical protein
MTTIHQPKYSNLSPQANIANLHSFSGPRAGRSASKSTLGSTRFNFFSSDIAAERGTPNAHNLSTSTTVYEGAIGN